MIKYQIGTRLQDPQGVLKDEPERLVALQDKISSCMTRLCRMPISGGNPFVFSYTASKEHELCRDLHDIKITTAATDGKKYYWCPEFLEKLSHDEAGIVMEHESYHVIFFHPTRGKSVEDKHVWNLAVDYVVNAVIEVEKVNNNRTVQLWGGALGKPLPLKELLEWIDGNNSSSFSDESRVFADKSLYGRSPESIYNEIMEHIKKSPRKCPTCGALSLDPKNGKSKINGKKPGQKNTPEQSGAEQSGSQSGSEQGPGQGSGQSGSQDSHCCPDCGAKSDGSGSGKWTPESMDNHVPTNIDKQEVMGDVMRARQTASTMRGYTPAVIEELLGELTHPTLTFTDLIRSACMRKTQEAGLFNNWKRLRRRYLPGIRPSNGLYQGQFLPTRHTHKPRWLAFLDTSGSMGSEDIIYAVSQLQCLGNTEGYVVPMDASVKWKDAVEISKADKNNLQKVKVTGRGGTDFTEAFKDYKKHMGNKWDCIIILTDGECGNYGPELAPSCDVVWVLTRNHKDWKQSFGRVAPLKINKL